MRWLVLLSVLAALAVLSSATLSKSDKKKKEKPAKKSSKKIAEDNNSNNNGPAAVGARPQSVFDLGLVNEEVTAGQIVQNHAAWFQDTARRRFSSGDVLGYVTPWNNHG